MSQGLIFQVLTMHVDFAVQAVITKQSFSLIQHIPCLIFMKKAGTVMLADQIKNISVMEH